MSKKTYEHLTQVTVEFQERQKFTKGYSGISKKLSYSPGRHQIVNKGVGRQQIYAPPHPLSLEISFWI